MNPNELGRVMEYGSLTCALRELSPDIHFDMGAALNLYHPRMDEFAGVFYMGRHIGAIDRGWIPEFSVWSVKDGLIEIPPELAGSIEGASTQFRVIDPSDPEFPPGAELAKSFAQGYAMEDGKLKHYKGYRSGKIRDRIIKIGWRYTLWKIVLAELPALDQKTIERKLRVDLMKADLHPPGINSDLSFQERANV